MKASCTKENLRKALAITAPAVASRATLPVTQNVKLTAENGHLRLSATNLEMSITTQVPAMIEDPGALTIPAKLFSDFVASLIDERIDLSAEQAHPLLQVKAGQSQASINGTPPDDFPPIPQLSAEQTISMDPAAMRLAIQRTAFAAATEESRPVLTGVELKLKGDNYAMSAADGFRLAVQSGYTGAHLEEETSLIAPAKTMSELGRLLADHSDGFEIIIPNDKRGVLFRIKGQETIELYSQLIAGSYPNTDQLIPSSYDTRIILEAATALRAVRTAAIFARDGSNIIRMEMNTDEENPQHNPTIMFSARSEQLGDEQEELGILEYEGTSGKIAFNSRYLTDLFSVLNKGNIALEMTTSSSPGLFRPTDSDDYIHIIMPMFVQW